MTKIEKKVRPTSVTLTLDSKDFLIAQPLTLGQLRDLGVGVATFPETDPQKEYLRLFNGALQLIAVALRVEHPTMTAQALEDSRATSEEMWAAMNDVLDFAGLAKKTLPAGEKATGEATPAP